MGFELPAGRKGRHISFGESLGLSGAGSRAIGCDGTFEQIERLMQVGFRIPILIGTKNPTPASI